MGTITQGITGAFSGKVGPVIGSSWKGRGYMRARPAKVANPKTAGQEGHRAKFAAIVRFMKGVNDFLRIGFYSQAESISTFNVAVSYNYRHALTGTYPDFAIDYSRVQLSSGVLSGALNPEVSYTPAGQLTFTWENNSNGTNALSTDRVLLAVYNPTSGKAVMELDGNTRASGSQTITLPPSLIGAELQCYIAFGNARELAVSNSQFVGEIPITRI
jgi:hypothetical protein